MKNKYMKNFIGSMSAVFAFLMLMAASCEKPQPPGPSEEVKPVFPAIVEKNDVEAGSVLTLTFEANMDWTVSVPSENLQWFWIKDGSFKVDKISGKVNDGEKKSVTVSVGVSETEEFDSNRSCEVTLSMGGESKVIAKYMRPALSRSIAVYAAKVVDGLFVMDSEGGYEYESAAAEDAALIWSAEDSDFRMPVRVDANCEWTAVIPEWMDVQIPESTVGSIEIVFTGASVEATSGSVVFMAGDDSFMELPVSVPACGELDVYTALIEDGEFLFDSSGNYRYSEQTSEEVALIWPGSDFRMPVKIDSRCDWELEMPEWLTVRYSGDIPATNAGITEFIFMGVPELYPLENTSGILRFSYEDQTIYEIPVSIPGCKDMFSYGLQMSMTEWVFTPDSKLLTTTGFQDIQASAWISGTDKVEVYAMELDGEGKPCGNAPDWLQMDVQSYVKGAEVLQRRSVSVHPVENTGKVRSAYILFSDGIAAEDFFSADGTLKSELEDYAVLVRQYGSDMEYVTMISSPEELAMAGAEIKESTNPRLKGWFGATDFMYEMTYSNPYARDEAFMAFSKPFASYKVYNAARQDVTEDGDFWLRFTPEPENMSGVIDMYMDMTPSSTKTTGYVVFYHADGSTAAIVVAVYDPSKAVEVEVNVEFIGDSVTESVVVGATLEKITPETDKELYDSYKEYMAPIYHLTYRTLDKPMRISVPKHALKYNPNPYSKRHNFVINGLDYDTNVGQFDLIDGGVDVYMYPSEGSTYERGVIFFHGVDDTVVLVLICTLDLTE